MRSFQSASIVLLCLIGLVWPVAVGKTGEGWSELRTTHFHLFSNADAEQVRAVATELERLRDLLESYFGLVVETPRRPLSVYVFRSLRSSRRVLPDGGEIDRSGGVYFSDGETDFIAIHAVAGADVVSLAYHEYLHYVIRQVARDAPLWFSEGMAELFETTKTTAYEGEVGRVATQHVETLKRGLLLSPRAVLETTPRSLAYRDAVLKPRFHAQSWAFVRYLLTLSVAEGARGGLLEKLRESMKPESLIEAMETSWASGFSDDATITIPLSRPISQEGIPKAIDRVEMTRRLGDLAAVHSPKRAKNYFRAALSADDRHAASHAGLGKLLIREGDTAEGLRHLRWAVELEPNDPRFRRLLGLAVGE
ncbi:MAG: DUF1570 domain-containing protein [Acidobacteriota bacterium]|nr:DUF1570 domain-containing protein [Acidobacteriota bacterium]MDH3783941.1 DUF1570 domain-containing protein [Acidobacteriota bacterium]